MSFTALIKSQVAAAFKIAGDLAVPVVYFVRESSTYDPTTGVVAETSSGIEMTAFFFPEGVKRPAKDGTNVGADVLDAHRRTSPAMIVLQAASLPQPPAVGDSCRVNGVMYDIQSVSTDAVTASYTASLVMQP